MKKISSLLLSTLCILMLLPSCKKAATNGNKGVYGTGTGSFVIDGTTTIVTADTLVKDAFSGGYDLIMKTSDNNELIFVNNMPTVSSGTTTLSDGSIQNDPTIPYISAYHEVNGTDPFFDSEAGGTGTITKTGATSFSFSCTMQGEFNPSITYTIICNGNY